MSTVYRNLLVQLCIAELVTDMSHDSCRMRGNPLRGICSKSPTGLSIGGRSDWFSFAPKVAVGIAGYGSHFQHGLAKDAPCGFDVVIR